MIVFVATSKRFYKEAARVVRRLEASGVATFHPYFQLDPGAVDADPDLKSRVTRQHFPEIDESDILYALLKGDYPGNSVAIEITYAYARGKTVIASELPDDYRGLRPGKVYGPFQKKGARRIELQRTPGCYPARTENPK